MVVNTLESLLTDPHLEATGFWKTMEHPTEGMLRFPEPPYAFSATPSEIRRMPPRLGEHSVEVLREAGFAPDEIDALVRSGATRDGGRSA
jgi:crotonobetainyl-CoA:carnitine CoA-transferase CaiB-like acyl-CoA transferase